MSTVVNPAPRVLRSKADLPEHLPHDPKAEKWGHTFSLSIRTKKGRVVISNVVDSFGNRLPITKRESTEKGEPEGFILPGTPGTMTWKQVVAAWPAFYAKQP